MQTNIFRSNQLTVQSSNQTHGKNIFRRPFEQKNWGQIKADQSTIDAQINNSKIKLMLVDDSLVIRSIIEQMISHDSRFEIVASVDNGQKAIDFLQHNNVDVIILDIEMPVLGGLAALPAIMANGNGARVLILSAYGDAEGAAAIKALSLGASDTLPKPGSVNFGGKFSDILCDRLSRLGESQIAVMHANHYVQSLQQNDDPICDHIMPVQRIEAIAIGASTGGITAAITLMDHLDGQFEGPIFFTQHLPESFIPFFARQLEESIKREVEIAKEGTYVRAKCIYLAPGDGHLTVVRDAQGAVRIKITDETVSSGCKPSTDPMFASIAEIYSSNACAILLSGMGNDGLVGARILANKGAPILAQSPDSCVVWGMPGNVVRDGIASAIMKPETMADYINRWASAA